MAKLKHPLRLGVDVAGQGRDASTFVYRHGDYVDKIEKSVGKSETVHMEVAGKVKTTLERYTSVFNSLYPQTMVDTIGEGAGVFSRLWELAQEGAAFETRQLHSSKFSEKATSGPEMLNDESGEREFLNMRAYCYWALRDWLDPQYGHDAALPPDDELLQELTETKWKTRSDGKIQLEEKEEIKERLRRSPDKADGVALTFWPVRDIPTTPKKKSNVGGFFH